MLKCQHECCFFMLYLFALFTRCSTHIKIIFQLISKIFFPPVFESSLIFFQVIRKCILCTIQYQDKASLDMKIPQDGFTVKCSFFLRRGTKKLSLLFLRSKSLAGPLWELIVARFKIHYI